MVYINFPSLFIAYMILFKFSILFLRDASESYVNISVKINVDITRIDNNVGA